MAENNYFCFYCGNIAFEKATPAPGNCSFCNRELKAEEWKIFDGNNEADKMLKKLEEELTNCPIGKLLSEIPQDSVEEKGKDSYVVKYVLPK